MAVNFKKIINKGNDDERAAGMVKAVFWPRCPAEASWTNTYIEVLAFEFEKLGLETNTRQTIQSLSKRKNQVQSLDQAV
jgi:hypothetical protein